MGLWTRAWRGGVAAVALAGCSGAETTTCEGATFGCGCGSERACGAESETRTRVTEPASRVPEQAIGTLGGCTGTLVSPRHVLTAAHCLGDVDGDRYAGTPTFTPGRDGDAAPHGSIAAVRVFLPEPHVRRECGWSEKAHPNEWDFALVELERDVTEVDPIPIARLDDDALVGATLRNRGYPAASTCAPPGWVANTMWGSAAVLSADPEHLTPAKIFSPLRGSPGHSGSAILATDPDTGATVAVGVFIGNYCGACNGPLSAAVRVAEVTEAYLRAWIEDIADAPCCGFPTDAAP